MPAFAIQLRRGTTSQHSTFTGLSGEVTVDTDKKTIVVHDGTTAGGIPLAKASETASGGLDPFLLMGA
jgi:RNase P/RNase MRP subunit p29